MLKEDNQLFAIDFYLQVNGVLELDKLKDLLKNSKIYLTDKEITNYIKTKEYIIEDKIIYFNEIAKLLNGSKKINSLKKKEKYKVFTLEEMYNIDKSFELLSQKKQLEKILSKYIKDKQKLNDIIDTIINTVFIGYDIANYIYFIYQKEKIDITVGDADEIDEIAMELYDNYPSWKLNGYSQNEIHVENTSLYHSLDDYEPEEYLSEDELIVTYITAYILINGIIKIDKFLEILNEEHNIKLTKSKLKKKIENLNYLSIDNTYIKLTRLNEEQGKRLINDKEEIDDYKIIDNPIEILEECSAITEKISNECKKYNVPEYLENYLIGLTNSIEITEEIISIIFNTQSKKIEHKQIRNIYQELKPYLDKARIWELNGYTIRECKKKIKIQKQKNKRNLPCPCGSGKKFKKCCGKQNNNH